MSAQIARYIPEGSNKLASKVSDAVVYLYKRLDAPCAIGYAGKSNKPVFRLRFASLEQRAKIVGDWLKTQDEYTNRKNAQKAEQKAKRALPHALKVGDVLRCSWGYEQTNIDFYEVTRTIGAAMVEVRQIARQSQETLHMQGECVPCPSAYIGEPMRRKVSDYGERDSIKINSYSYAYRMQPLVVAGSELKVYQTSHWTAYA